MKDSIGIDISKDHLDVHRCATGAAARFTNDPAGFRALKRWIGDRQPHLLIYEATGPYHGRFEQALAGKLPLVKVNPLQARRFAQRASAPGPRPTRWMRAFWRRWARRSIWYLKTQTLAMTRRHTKARLAQVERQLIALQGEIAIRLKASAKRARAYAILRSIRGIGDVVAAAILIECPEIGTLGKKQAAALAGLAPMTRQSGSGKARPLYKVAANTCAMLSTCRRWSPSASIPI